MTRWPYAELHYRPAGRGALFLPWPALYADVPCRLTPGEDLPLLISVRHADRWPCRLHSLRLLLVDPEGRLSERAIEGEWRLGKHMEALVPARIPLPRPGSWEFLLDGVLEADGRRLPFRNQSSPAFPEESLRCEVLAVPDPGLPGLRWGDCQVHGSATRDMVEFGAPLPLLKEAARALALDWFCLTDHSYDLVRGQRDTQRDPAFPRWRELQQESAEQNAAGGPRALVGEELSCAGLRGGVLHLLLLGQRTLLEGGSDGGGRFPWSRPEHGLRQALDLLDGEALAIASHPGEKPSLLERAVLLRRDWRGEDLRQLEHWQICNGGHREEWRRGLRQAIRLWGEGRRGLLLAGNDSHGSFSINREVRIPSRSVIQHRRHLFGNWRSGIFRQPGLELAALRSGPVLLGNGPLLWFGSEEGPCGADQAACRLRWQVPERCGRPIEVDLLQGDGNGESVIQRMVDAPARGELSLPGIRKDGWLRAELRSPRGEALTNPLWN